MPARIALLGDKDPGHVTHGELEAAVALLPDWVDARWVGSDTPEAHAPEAFVDAAARSPASDRLGAGLALRTPSG